MRIVAVVVVLHAIPALFAQECTPMWDTSKGLPGMNSTVNALTAYDDGSGVAIYAGGRFTMADDVNASKIAKWNGSSWSKLGVGIEGVIPAVNALTVYNTSPKNTLIVGGQFTKAGSITTNNIAQWDGQSWSAMGGGTNDSVFAAVTYFNPTTLHEDLIIGGAFTMTGDVAVNRIAGWDGNEWYALGEGLNGEVSSLIVFDDGLGSGPALYAGGSFTASGLVTTRRIAKWDGESWSSLSGGMSARVFAMTVFNDGFGPALYAGGEFLRADGSNIVVNHVAKWNGTNWFTLGVGTSGTVRSMTVFDDGTGFGPSLYVGGIFTMAGLVNANRIAMWDGATWFPLSSGMDNAVFALTPAQQFSNVGSAMYAGGSFQLANLGPANYIAQWTGCVDRPGDFDGNGFTGLDDFISMQNCLSGPDANIPGQCDMADLDLDGDVDLYDMSIFQHYFFPAG